MKRVLIIGPAWPFRGGGITTFNERLCRALKEQGHQCEILSFRLQYPDFLFPGKTQYSTDPAPADLRIYSLVNSISPMNWLSVGQRFKKEKYDLVIFRYWLSFMAPAFGTIARMIRRNKHTRIIAITDNIIPHEKRFFDTLFTRYFTSACDGFLTMSHSVLSQLEQLVPGKPKAYVPHPMYDMFGPEMSKADAKKKLGLDERNRHLLFFGFIRKYKGLHLLLEAFADERIKQMKDLKLIVAGEFYEDPKPYLEQVKKLGLEDRVIMSNDFIPNSEVSSYFCAADGVIQTYLDATQSGVTQIAYFYNKPMIVTDVGGLAELVPHNKAGLVCKVDPKSVADAIVDYYTGNKEQVFTRNMPEEKQKFTWENLCRELLNLGSI